MRITVLLSWYDENPAWLAAAIASTASFADHVVAVDGAYSLYPGSTGISPTGQADAIREAARALKIGCTVHEPSYAWPGNEVEKRDFMFRLGEQTTDPDDWYFVLDGDELVTDTGYDLRQACAETDRDCAEVAMWQYRQHYEPHERPFVTDRVETTRIRVMFRAVRGLTVKRRHYVYETPDGRMLWGDGGDKLEPAADFTHLRLQHRNEARDAWRAQNARTYYATRDSLNVEGLHK